MGMYSMQIPHIIRDRRSIRAFTSREITEKEAELLVEASCMAPSAGNLQPWEFVVVRDPEIKRKLVDAALGQSFISQAPIVFVVCAVAGRSASRYRNRGRELYCLQDTAAAVQNLILTAKANGLGSCWVGAISPKDAAKVMNLPDNMFVHDFLILGYPDETPKPRPRKDFDKLVFWEKYE